MPDTMKPEQTSEAVRTTENIKSLDTLAADIQLHIVTTLGDELYGKDKFRYFYGLAYSIRDRLIKMWLDTQRESTTAWSKGYTICRSNSCPEDF